MTRCTAVGESGANRAVGVKVAVAFIASLSLQPREFALEELPSTPDGAKRVPLDDEDRGVPTVSVAASGTHFVRQGFCYPYFCCIRRLGLICKLSPGCTTPNTRQQSRP